MSTHERVVPKFGKRFWKEFSEMALSLSGSGALVVSLTQQYRLPAQPRLMNTPPVQSAR